jgi:hypothetical protein
MQRIVRCNRMQKPTASNKTQRTKKTPSGHPVIQESGGVENRPPNFGRRFCLQRESNPRRGLCASGLAIVFVKWRLSNQSTRPLATSDRRDRISSGYMGWRWVTRDGRCGKYGGRCESPGYDMAPAAPVRLGVNRGQSKTGMSSMKKRTCFQKLF